MAASYPWDFSLVTVAGYSRGSSWTTTLSTNPNGDDQSWPTIMGITSGHCSGQLSVSEGMYSPLSLVSPQPKGVATVSNATLGADVTIDLNPYQ